MGKNILSIQPSQKDLWKKAEAMGYVWVKTPSGFIVVDELNNILTLETSLYQVFLDQKTYGTEWAFTKEELE